jgi:diaminopimelate decarboxylase
VKEILRWVKKRFAEKSISLPEIWFEHGRSIVGEAGTTLYRLGAIKRLPGLRTYVSVDGGMSDNIRPALYQASHEAILANRALEPVNERYSIAGKLCESGDMLIWDIDLPTVHHNDLLAVSCTGAYGYSMASNYNRIPRPAVIFVRNGEARLIIQRETYEDLIRNDVKRIPQLIR